MIAIPLGKVAVPTHGTPVALAALVTAAAAAQKVTLGPGGQVAKIDVWAVVGNTGAVQVKIGGTIAAELPTPANGHAAHWSAAGQEKLNTLNPSQYAIDASTTDTDGAYVTVWVA